MTNLCHQPPTRANGARHVALVIALALTGPALAATIGEVGAPTLDSSRDDAYEAPGGELDFRSLDQYDAPPPVARAPRVSRAEIAKLVDSLPASRPEVRPDSAWELGAAAVPPALEPEALMREAGGAVWLDEAAATRNVASQGGLGDLLRGLVNVHDATAGSDEPGQAATPVDRPRAADSPGGNPGADVMRGLLAAAIEPHRRADGRVGFSVFGVGEFVAHVDAALRSVSLYEENTGWRATLERPDRPQASPVAAAADKALAGEEGGTPAAAALRYPGRQVAPVDVSVMAMFTDAVRWARDSLLLRLLLAAWIAYAGVRALMSLDRGLRARRRRLARRGEPSPLPVSPGATAVAAAAADTPTRSRRSRRGRRRRRSPTMRNLLRTLGIA